MKTASLRIYGREGGSIGWLQVTDAQILNAIERYDSEYPFNDHPRTDERPHIKTWLENQTYTFAIKRKGKCYPPKHILRLAIEEDCLFYGGGQPGNANWVLENLGFEAISKSEC